MIVEGAQAAQDAQAGYACDYCTKRQPMAFNEVKECCKGHHALAERTRQEPLSRIGKRHAIRIMSDAYGKGIFRGQVENTNHRAYTKKTDVTAAESIKTCQTVIFVRAPVCGHSSALERQAFARKQDCACRS